MSLPLLNAKKQYFDQNGNPLAGGSVAYYQPGTLTPVNTYQDQGLSVLNSNPLVLDANGQAIAWISDGTSVREIVKDSLGNQIWDQVTATGLSQLYVLSVKQYGAKGDGITDDTSAIVAADQAASSQGKSLLFPSGTYVASTLSPLSKWIGQGVSSTRIIRSPGASAGTLIQGTNGIIDLMDLTVDGNKANCINGGNNIYMPSSATKISLVRVNVQNAKSVSGWGSGVVIDGSQQSAGSVISQCIIQSNDASGMAIENANDIFIIGNVFNGNGGDGLAINNYDQTFTQKLYSIRVIGNHFSGNAQNGCIIGNFVQNNNLTTPIYGIGNPEAQYCLATGNKSTSNGYYGFSISGFSVLCANNIAFANSAASINTANFLFNAQYSSLINNISEGSLGCGIDAGGAQSSIIMGNVVHGSATSGINLESNADIHVCGNYLSQNDTSSGGIQMVVDRFGGASQLQAFTTPGQNITIGGNHIYIDGTRIGIRAVNNPANVLIEGNTFTCANPSSDVFRCVYAIGGSIKVKRNTLVATGFNTLTPTGGGVLEVPDIMEYALLNSATTIGSLQNSSGILVGTGVAYCSITAGGSGYTSAPTVSFSGGGGSGAAGYALVSASGVVTGIRMTAYGAGYTSAPTVSISGGGGSGATAVAQWKLGIAEEKELTIQCNTAEVITRLGAVVVESPSAADISVPVRGMVTLQGQFGQWYLKSKNF